MIQVDNRTFADLAVAVHRICDCWGALLAIANRDPDARMSGTLFPFAAELTRRHSALMDLVQAIWVASDEATAPGEPSIQ